ncbi:MAG: DUF1295 domain-containing protein [Spirochaetales bacterium]|nr:DUF1295 domain-containing protein [Spirochaetales bacterium]MCF7937840.1 DUF1295 domain-containing protein [Spirochaetales bacterium]
METLTSFLTGRPAGSIPPEFEITLWLLLAVGAAVFIAGLATGNYSHVDRLWSLLPPVYVLIWAGAFFREPLFLVPCVLVVLWGARLTFNFARRGGYRFDFRKGFTGEDYRWAVLRKSIGNRFLFELFNLFFITAFQLIIIFLFTMPLFLVGMEAGRKNLEFDWLHILLAGCFLLCLLGETVADNQQYRFQATKASRTGPGFNTNGLWRYSRHPNYAFELLQWVLIALYAVASGADPVRAGAGALLLIILFAGSTRLTEGITRSKYPDYEHWQRITSVWVPGIKTLLLRRKRKSG